MGFFIISLLFSIIFTATFYLYFNYVQRVRYHTLGEDLDDYYIDSFESIAMKLTYWAFYFLSIFCLGACIYSLLKMGANETVFNVSSANSKDTVTKFTPETLEMFNVFIPTIAVTGTAFLVWTNIEFLRKAQKHKLVMSHFQNAGGILCGLIIAQAFFSIYSGSKWKY